MSSDKKITKEDTWTPADLRKHIREGGHMDDNVRRRDDNERKHCGGESEERPRRDPGKDSRQEKDKPRERRDREEIDKYADRRKEGSRDRRADKERDRHEETRKRYDDDKERHRDKEDRDRRREDRDKERRREEREHRKEKERRRNEEGGEGKTERREKQGREKREKHRERDKDEDKKNERERRERKHVEVKEEGENKEEQKRRKEEKERRHKERGNHDEKQKHDSRSREHREVKGSVEKVRRHGADREQTERDKKKERKHREEEEPEKNHQRDRTGSRRSEKESDKSHDTKSEAAKDEDLADYEDDFEDYEEDFEEMDESPEEGENEKEPSEVLEENEEVTAQRRKEIEAIQRAMDEENQRVQSREISSTEEEERPRWSRGSEKAQSVDSQRGKFIDFVAAKQREVSKKVASKQKKRSTELLRLIDLDFSTTASLLELPPVNEYDMYIRTFGTENTKQAYVQCNEDNVDRDIQTEETDVCEKWTQHPPEHSGPCGDPNLSREAQDKSEMSFDSQRLTAFLRSASQVMVVLLEEHRADRTSLKKLKSPADTMSFSDGSLLLNTKLPFLYGRSISLLRFSPVQRHTMMSVHRPTETPSAVRLDSCTIICIWNIWEPSTPQRVLIYESEVQCCCFSPGKAVLVFAGTSVGSVLLWDLRENTEDHYSLKIGEGEWTFRQPTFSTDALMSGSGHFSSVTSVEVVPSTSSDIPLLASEEESSGLSFQLASLDEVGVLNFWVVLELPKANEAGSPTDLGLRPGGKVKLLHSSVLLTTERVSPRDAAKTATLQTLNFKFLPTDSNHFFIGTNMGLVNHETSHGLKASPRFYRFQEAGVRPVDVTSIHFSPFRKHLFLVGCGDGSIRLHAVNQEQPVSEWRNSTAGEPVVSLQWNQTRPSVFCVLDGASNLHIWDLLRNDTQPMVTERLDSDSVTAMTVFGDSGQQNTYSGVAVAHKSGKIEMQYFTRTLTVSGTEEEEKLDSLVTEAF
ncbi:hypothetical protein PBY51_013885 [Eleginops maclovinus]|uniref:WD repeat-containing protein 60 n=1 Tax=Eleginops maclovinus TaxID=56733 RepID=A0AAN7WXZ3_ELEMC|nr:hypothetical protein PBY51_013885 [Eleginops maclovinus]